MAHEIDMSNNRANIAYVGETPWHNLGQRLTENAPLETWVKEAGLDWTAEESPVTFNTPDGQKNFVGRTVLYRSDTLAPLGVVSEDYHIVQPRDVIEFFKEAAGQADMKLEVAGSLFGGKRFWATARVNEEALKVNGVDEVKPYVFLITSLDGTLATNASLVSTRVVCNNTARIALGENGKRVRQTHAAEFDANMIKNQLGLIDNAWFRFKERVTKMANTKVDALKATEFFLKLVGNEDAVEQSLAVRRKVDDLMTRFQAGIGAEMHKGTAWGLYNAVTERANYQGRGMLDHKMQSALFGANAALINKADELITELL